LNNKLKRKAQDDIICEKLSKLLDFELKNNIDINTLTRYDCTLIKMRKKIQPNILQSLDEVHKY